VRPPSGSFSWVPAADAYLLPGGKVVEITSPSAVSWIGTSLGSAKQYRWQVKLKQGEQLGVLGEQSARSSDGKEVLWYKIAPPAGEFRWIDEKSVSSVPIPAEQPIAAKKKPTALPQGETLSRVKPASASRQLPGKAAALTQVVTAAYQQGPSDGAIVLGPGEGYSDGGPMEGDIIYEGEGVEGPVVEEGGYIDGDYVEGGNVDGEYVDGEYVDGEYVDGEYVDGQIIDGQFIDGEIAYDSGDYVVEGTEHKASDHFAGWHAMDLGDDGMRLTWLERLYTRARQRGPDPLAADPFDLSMARGTVRPNSAAAHARMAMAGDLYEPVGPVMDQRRRGGWRDPRSLRSNRSSSFAMPVAAPEVTTTNTDSETTSGLAGSNLSQPTGLERVAGALTSARAALTNSPLGTSQPAATPISGTLVSSTANAQSAMPDVNWYGIPANSSPASIASPVTSFDLSQLQVMLSEIVTQPMHLWNLQNIYDSAKHYVEHGGSPIERGQARLLMERVEEFAELAQRSGYLALSRTANAAASLSPSNNVMLAGATTGNATAPSVVSSEFQDKFGSASNFDASGWLVPVIAASPGQPTHALADQTGRILSYVTAVPGLNLDRYVNQAVGVTGLRGYLPQLQAGHIQAQRVVRVQ
jgi:hypothetical protein